LMGQTRRSRRPTKKAPGGEPAGASGIERGDAGHHPTQRRGERCMERVLLILNMGRKAVTVPAEPLGE